MELYSHLSADIVILCKLQTVSAVCKTLLWLNQTYLSVPIFCFASVLHPCNALLMGRSEHRNNEALDQL